MLNKRGGWKKFQKLINGEVPIRAWRVEKVSKINKRASLFIRQVRVLMILNKEYCIPGEEAITLHIQSVNVQKCQSEDSNST